MTEVLSRDGTTIAFDRIGSGDPIVLVDGALCDRSSGPNAALAQVLSEHFTVFTYDRRGRGESSDTGPYHVDREIEDLDAVIGAAGGSAYVYGISSGGALALEAATRGSAIERLVLFELPFVVDHTRKPIPASFAADLVELVASGRRGAAVTHFLRAGVGLPAMMVVLLRLMPAWKKLKALAHTLPYDAMILGDDTGRGGPLPAGRWASLTAPTLVIGGGKSPEWMRNSVRALAELLGAEHCTLEGQTHLVKAQAIAPALVEFCHDESHARLRSVA
jgi:pimeloyl-ACP methyl ester carboxylesterase